MRHLTTLFEMSKDDVLTIYKITADLKAKLRAGDRPPLLKHRVLTQIFDKPSLRTRLSFEAAIIQLGGQCSFFSAKDAGLYGRESLPDVARVASSFSDAVVLRTYSHSTIDEFARWSQCPVINGLSDDYHPCQALTDLFTVGEVFQGFSGQHVVFVGDGNNVAASLAILTSTLGLSLTLACPAGYELPEELLAKIRRHYPGGHVQQTNDVKAAVRGADILYTDVWASMGQENEADERQRDFAGYQVNCQLMDLAPGHCRFMHDLPARRGQEVTDEIIDGDRSIVFQQAENRMHVAKGILVWLLDAFEK